MRRILIMQVLILCKLIYARMSLIFLSYIIHYLTYTNVCISYGNVPNIITTITNSSTSIPRYHLFYKSITLATYATCIIVFKIEE